MIVIGGLAAQLVLDASGWQQGIQVVQQSLAGLQRQVNAAGSTLTTGLSQTANALGNAANNMQRANTTAAGLSRGLGQAATALARAADNLNRATAAAQAHAPAMRASGDASSRAAGQYRQAAQEAGGLANFLEKGVSMASNFAVAFTIFQGGRAVLQGLKESVVDFNAELQQSRIAWGNMLGDIKLGELAIRDLQQFAVTTPFEFPALQKQAQNMMAMGFAFKDIIPVLTDVGNAMTASGEIAEERLQRIIRAMGQMESKGRVMSEEMNQMAEAQIPAWEILAEKLGVTTGRAREMVEQGLVAGRTFREAFSEWSKANFGDAMAEQSDTFKVAVSNMRDGLRIFLSTGLVPVFDALSEFSVRVSKHVQSKGFQDFAIEVKAWSTVVIEALGLLAQVFGTIFGTILDTVSTMGRGIYQALQWINPFAAHSDPLVTSVEKGVEKILEDYRQLEKIEGILTGIGSSMERFRIQGEGALNSFDTEKLQRDAATLVSVFGSDVADAFKEATVEMRGAREMLRSLTEDIKEQEAALRERKRELDSANDAIRDQERELRNIEIGGRVYRDSLRELRSGLIPLKDDLEAARDALNDKKVAVQNAKDALEPFKQKVDETAQAEQALSRQTTRLKEDLQDLLRAPMEGEAAFRRASGSITDQITQLDARIATARAARAGLPSAIRNQPNPALEQMEAQRERLQAQLQVLRANREAATAATRREIEIAQLGPEKKGSDVLAGVKNLVPMIGDLEERRRAAQDIHTKAVETYEREERAVKELEKGLRPLEANVRSLTDAHELQERRIRHTEAAYRDYMSVGEDIKAQLEEERLLRDNLKDQYEDEREQLQLTRDGYQEVRDMVKSWEAALADVLKQGEQVHQWRRQEEQAEKAAVAEQKRLAKEAAQAAKEAALNQPGASREERREVPNAAEKLAELEAEAAQFQARVSQFRADAQPFLDFLRELNEIMKGEIAQNILKAVGAVLALKAGIEVVLFFGRQFLGLIGLISPQLLAAIGVVLALKTAWENDFLGMRSAIEEFMERLGPLGPTLEALAGFIGMVFGPEAMGRFEAWTAALAQLIADVTAAFDGLDLTTLEGWSGLIGRIFGPEAMETFERFTTFIAETAERFDIAIKMMQIAWERLLAGDLMGALGIFQDAVRFAFSDIGAAVHDELLPALGELKDRFLEWIGTTATDIGITLKDEWIPPFLAFVEANWPEFRDAMASWLDAFFGWIADRGKDLFTTLKDEWIPQFVNWVGANWQAFRDALGPFALNVMNWIKEQGPELLRTLVAEWIPNFIAWILGTGLPMSVQFLAALAGFLGQVKDWIHSKRVEISTSFMSWHNEILSSFWTWVRDAGLPGFKDMGLALAGGLLQGMKDGLGNMGGMLHNWLTQQLQNLQGLEEVKSPSRRWAREIGLPLGEGVAMGIEWSKTAVADAVEGLTRVPAPSFAQLPPAALAGRAPAGTSETPIQFNSTFHIDTLNGSESQWAQRLAYEQGLMAQEWALAKKRA